MNVALCPLRTNVVSANAPRPSGAGSAAGTASTSVGTGRTSATVAMATPFLSSGKRKTFPCFLPGRLRSETSDSGSQVVRVPRQVLGAVGSDEDEVLESQAAEAGPVEPGLDGHDVARAERLPRRHAELRLLVHLEADAVSQPVEEPLLQRPSG